MGIRKNAAKLTARERDDFITALLAIKNDGNAGRLSTYDRFVSEHLDSMATLTPPAGDTVRPIRRNAAHRGPAFLPWHRQYLQQIEVALQRINPEVSIPYWNWTADESDPEASPIFSNDFMGGNGEEAAEWVVPSGPFAHSAGNWNLNVDTDIGGVALRRRFGKLVFRDRNGVPQEDDTDLPTEGDVLLAMQERTYDMYPYDSRSQTWGFRNRLEGWLRRDSDPRITSDGTQLHNRVHVFIGGNWWTDAGQQSRTQGTMLLGSSPNDPIFLMHHAFIDKLWADWQMLQNRINPGARPHYMPIEGGPFGHNLFDPMYPWAGTVTPYSMLRHHELDYGYDTDGDEERMDALVEAVTKCSKDGGPQRGALMSMFFHYE